jgi:hypothetical protein
MAVRLSALSDPSLVAVKCLNYNVKLTPFFNNFFSLNLLITLAEMVVVYQVTPSQFPCTSITVHYKLIICRITLHTGRDVIIVICRSIAKQRLVKHVSEEVSWWKPTRYGATYPWIQGTGDQQAFPWIRMRHITGNPDQNGATPVWRRGRIPPPQP